MLPSHPHSAAVTFICAVWLLGGYINTMANIISPRLVPPHVSHVVWRPAAPPPLLCLQTLCKSSFAAAEIRAPPCTPPRPPPQLKGSAAGVMAIAYQVAHFLGLALATLLVYLLYGKIGVE